MAASDLPGAWRARADELERYAAPAAAAFRTAADELEEATRAAEDELVGQAEAARLAHLSTRRIRDLEAEGALRNHGRRGAPLYRVGDLPIRRGPKPPASSYDPDEDADEIVRRMAS